MSDGHFDRFVAAVYKTENEREVMSYVFPQIVGKTRYPSRQNVKFGNLSPLAKGIVVPQPGYYEGEDPGQGNRTLRGWLERSIVPSLLTNGPFLPNFFAEAKGISSTIRVAQLQACQDGALGSRAMHRVENLGREEEIFDNKARTASVIYHGRGSLEFAIHHHSQPRGPGTDSETCMTSVNSFSLSGDPDRFREGVASFRNIRDYAHRLRKESIENAHRRMGIVTPEPSTIPPRSTRRPLSYHASSVENGISNTRDSSEVEDSDDRNHKQSSKAPLKRKPLKSKVVTATPKRPAKNDPPPPRLRPRRECRRP
ncbi:hypothetical protein IMSHALPRED_010100 [Imshaugia aleurites]|uniref:Uncharacterized protein n=1 Tax=Imshaugia aleurites TaxID=172621 RepID=A0A8H3G8V2_9LECA|nr:hypothetical protein IMSHALPRED_010100 [Imshaugia aleurites]